MMRNLIPAVLVASCLFAAISAAPRAQEPPAAAGEVALSMTARNYAFDPAVITVKRGDHVKLVITSTDRAHGIKIAAYGISQRLNKGVPTSVEFTADKAGTFPFECSAMCGLGHRRMKGKLVVEDSSGAGRGSPPGVGSPPLAN